MQDSVSLNITIATELYRDLQEAAQACASTPAVFAREAVECCVAERRLANLPPSEDPKGPRHYKQFDAPA